MAATDASLLATQVDAVVLVVAAGKTRDFELEQALDTLDSVGAPIIGTVLNGFDATKTYAYKYKYRYGYKYGYSYGSSTS